MRREQRGDGNFFVVIRVGQNHVLIRAQTEFDVRKFFCDVAQRDFLRILHAASFNEQSEKPFSVRGFVPDVYKRQVPRRAT